MNDDPLIINVAVTGNVPRTEDNPHLPTTPAEIARDVEACRDVGASIVHVHARGEDETPVPDRERFEAIVQRIRKRCPDIIVCVTTSGRVYTTFEQRSAGLDLEPPATPEMASLTLGSNNFAGEASMNSPEMIRALAGKMSERGIVPELEVFERGMVDVSRYLLRKGILQPPLYYNILLGSLGTMQASAENLVHVTRALPEGATWAATGIGDRQFPVQRMAIAMGGHVRTGLEDNVWMTPEREELATNVKLVERVADLAEANGRPVATPAQAREIIGLDPR